MYRLHCAIVRRFGRIPTDRYDRSNDNTQLGNETRVPGYPKTRVNPPVFKPVNPGLCASKNPGLTGLISVSVFSVQRAEKRVETEMQQDI